MMEDFRTLVLYRTSHGSTKRYAEWIADALNGEAMEATKKTSPEWMAKIQTYDFVIFGANINARGMNGLPEFKSALTRVKPKNIAYFCVGSYPAGDQPKMEHYNDNFKPGELDEDAFFYFRGRLDFIGLGFLEKRILGAYMKKIEKMYPEDRNEAEASVLEAYYDDVDWSDKRTIIPLVKYVRGFMTQEQKDAIEPIAKARMAATAQREEEEEAAWEAEMQRREELHKKNVADDEAYKLKHMKKKQREAYLAKKAAEKAAEEGDDEALLNIDETIDDYSDFEDDKE